MGVYNIGVGKATLIRVKSGYQVTIPSRFRKEAGLTVEGNDGIDIKAPNYRSLAARIKADCFVFTGEVLGQRPMSQHMQSLKLIEKECGIAGYLLRPLSAKHLPSTMPERLGWVDRERLLSISGRSRKEQMSWSERFGLSDYPQPAGGCCFLADENFARRFHDKKEHSRVEEIRREELILLKVGRHFRLSPGVKIIVARDEAENRFLARFEDLGWRFEALECGSPVTLVEGEPDENLKQLIAAITARYSDRRGEPLVEVAARRADREERLLVPPVADRVLEAYRI